MALTRRSALLGSIGVIGTFTGCSGNQSTTPDSTCPYKRVTAVPLPDPPASLTADSAVTYATKVEQAYQYRKNADGDTVEFDVNRMDSTVEQNDSGYLVTLNIAFSAKSCHDGSLGVGSGGYQVRYHINRTTVYRAQIEDAQSDLDPRKEGTRLPV